MSHTTSSRIIGRPVRSTFTLIELLVCISIIAILAALLMPALGKAKRRAQMVVCLGNISQIGGAAQMYLADNGQAYPFLRSVGSGASKCYGFFGNKADHSSLADLEVDEKPLNAYMGVTESNVEDSVVVCPSSRGVAFETTGSSYMVAARRANEAKNDLDRDGTKSQKLGRIKSPSKQIFASSWIGFHYTKYGWATSSYTPMLDLHGDGRAKFPYVFVDGHASFYTPSPGEGWTRPSDEADWKNGRDY